MARPERNTVDYFPFDCQEGKKMFYIEETYGNDGFAVFVKLLREFAKTDNHYLNLRENTTLMYLAAKCKVPKDLLITIITDLCELGKFDKELWKEKIIWCQDFVDSVQDAYKKRNNECITLDRLRILLPYLSNPKPILPDGIDTGNTQRKEKNIKEEKSKEETLSFFSEDFKKFIDWVNGIGDKIMKLRKPFTEKEYLTIKKNLLNKIYSLDDVRSVLEAMQNKKSLLSDYESAYLTFSNWMKIRKEKKVGPVDESRGKLKYADESEFNKPIK